MSSQKRDISYINLLLIYIPFLILLLFLKPRTGSLGDINWWINWTIFDFNEGLSHIYRNPDNNYMPFFHYILYLYGIFQGSTENIINNIYILKNIAILFEFGSTLILFTLIKEKLGDTYKALFFSLFYLLNLSVLYNSLIWGQVDSIMTFFVFASIYFAYKKRFFWTLIFFVLALNMKLQAIIFLPVIIIMSIPMFFEKKNLKKNIFSLFGALIFQFLVLLPFIIVGDLKFLWREVTGSVDKYSVVSMNAFNMWNILMSHKVNLIVTPDSIKFIGISYKNWGFILFFISGFFAMYHFIKPLIQILFKKIRATFTNRKILITCALIPLLFFFFNTQMHERYSHPALIFLAAYAILYKRPLPFITGSVAYFFNMETVLLYFERNNYYTFEYTLFTSKLIGCLFLLTIILLYLDLFDIKLRKIFNLKNPVKVKKDNNIYS